MFANWCLRFLPAHTDWEIIMAKFPDDSFQRGDSQILEKDIPGLEPWREAGRRLTSQRGSERIYG